MPYETTTLDVINIGTLQLKPKANESEFILL